MDEHDSQYWEAFETLANLASQPKPKHIRLRRYLSSVPAATWWAAVSAIGTVAAAWVAWLAL